MNVTIEKHYIQLNMLCSPFNTLTLNLNWSIKYCRRCCCHSCVSDHCFCLFLFVCIFLVLSCAHIGILVFRTNYRRSKLGLKIKISIAVDAVRFGIFENWTVIPMWCSSFFFFLLSRFVKLSVESSICGKNVGVLVFFSCHSICYVFV